MAIIQPKPYIGPLPTGWPSFSEREALRQTFFDVKVRTASPTCVKMNLLPPNIALNV